MGVLGPNTAASSELLCPAMLLCGGEDPRELERALDAVGAVHPKTFHEYRCYRFWQFDQVTVAWTGIGTGCLEPMLWELLAPGVVKRFILFGSAGKLPNARVAIGEPHCVSAAYSGGTSLDADIGEQPIRPRFEMPASRAEASIVSTDFYYGFTPRVLDGTYPAAGEGLRSAVSKYLNTCDMVDMETAQFYHFCNRFDRTGELQYLSIKGAANDLQSQMEQLDASEGLLVKCLRLAWDLLGFDAGK